MVDFLCHFNGLFCNFGSKIDTNLYYMRKSTQLTMIITAALLMGAVSCSTEVYDEKKHEELIKYVSPVDSVDQQHTWQLTTNQTYTVSVGDGGGTQRVDFYNANPVSQTDAELMGRVFATDGQTVNVSLSIPSIQNVVYAALVDGDGKMTVTPFNKTKTEIDFLHPTFTKASPVLSTPQPMAYTYCYEENFPEPGDYDYNDAVMRISVERTAEKVMSIGVTLSAVGASRQIAGAIRLVGYDYEDIDSIVTREGKTFNENVPQPSYGILENDEIMLKGRNGEAVINLFVDAHWSMDILQETLYGNLTRKKYNVSKNISDTYELVFAKTVVYDVHFKDASALNHFTLDSLDPFIMSYYIGNKMEIHTDEFAAAQTLYNYNVLSFKDLPWALKIPTRYFRYPLEGCEIGFRKKTSDGTSAMFGAYMTKGHSFGEWAENHNDFLDWYQYPTENQVW